MGLLEERSLGPCGAGHWRSAGALLADRPARRPDADGDLARTAPATRRSRSERHSYDVMLLTRTVDGTDRPRRGGARPLRARRGRDDQRQRSTAANGGRPQQLIGRAAAAGPRRPRAARAGRARCGACSTTRGRELAPAPRAAAAGQARQRRHLALLPGAARTPTGPQLRRHARADRHRRARGSARSGWTRPGLSATRSDQLTEWLGWLAVLIGARRDRARLARLPRDQPSGSRRCARPTARPAAPHGSRRRCASAPAS